MILVAAMSAGDEATTRKTTLAMRENKATANRLNTPHVQTGMYVRHMSNTTKRVQVIARLEEESGIKM